MTHKKTPTDLEPDLGLDAFFAAHRGVEDQPSEDLMNSVLISALAAQPKPADIAPSTKSRLSWGWDVWQSLGGWPAATALSACLVLGLSLGYTTPDGLSDVAETMLSGVGLGETDGGYLSLDDLMVEG